MLDDTAEENVSPQNNCQPYLTIYLRVRQKVQGADQMLGGELRGEFNTVKDSSGVAFGKHHVVSMSLYY